MSDSSSEIRARQARRFAYLKHLYEDAQRVPEGQMQDVHAETIGTALGLSADERHRIEQYLSERGLIEYTAMGPHVALTARGIDYVENALAEPDEPTAYFPPINVLHIEQVVNSQIQQGTTSSAQTGGWNSGLDVQQLRALLSEIREGLSGLPLAPDDRRTVDANLATLQAQAESPKPSTPIIRESLRLLGDAISGAGGTLLAEKLGPLLRAFGVL